MSEIYMQNILDHYKNPHHEGKLKDFTSSHEEKNTLCGDTISVTLRLEKGILKDAKFQGVGCAVSQAAISMLLDEVIGMKKEKIMKLKKDDVLEMLGITLGPVRLKCALLGLETLHKAIQKN